MIFTDIRLQNYRSYSEASFELGPGVNIVVGPNAVGKTNLLEALMLVAVGKSYKARDQALIRNSEDWARIDVHTEDNHTRVVKIKKLDLVKTSKTFEIDGREYKRLNANTKQPVVLFQPDDLRLLHGDPSRRRDYFDDLIEQYIPGYSTVRRDLKRVVAQRNALLKTKNIGTSQLFAWDIRLADVASKVIKERIKLTEEINKTISDIYGNISSKKHDIKVEYFSKVDISNYSNNLIKNLADQREIDKIRGFTSRGPHRDDIITSFDGVFMSDTASRGENRTFVLALKTIELQILERETGKRPLLLLDDVFSELDGSRRRSLTSLLKNYQTVITTTDADIVSQSFANKALVIALTEDVD